jgi:hypothetical protein
MGGIALPESVNELRRRIDWTGFLLAGVAVGFATYATIAGETWGYYSSGALTLYSIAGACLLAYFYVESVTTHPMLNVRWVRNRAFAGSAVIAFTSYFAIFSIFFFVALYLEVIGSVSAYTLARDFLPMLAGIVVAALYTGRWVARVGSRVPMTMGCALAGAGVLLSDLVLSPSAGLSTLGWTMGLAGIGFGMIVVPVNSSALVSLPASSSGIAASTINTARELGAVTGVAILGSIVNGQLTVNLVRRLTQIGVPPSFRQQIIEDVVTGTAASKASAESRGSGAAVRHIINEVVHAAYGAFTHGLNLALTVSGILLLVSGVIAYSTGTAERSSMVKDDEEVVAA